MIFIIKNKSSLRIIVEIIGNGKMKTRWDRIHSRLAVAVWAAFPGWGEDRHERGMARMFCFWIDVVCAGLFCMRNLLLEHGVLDPNNFAMLWW